MLAWRIWCRFWLCIERCFAPELNGLGIIKPPVGFRRAMVGLAEMPSASKCGALHWIRGDGASLCGGGVGGQAGLGLGGCGGERLKISWLDCVWVALVM